ncbi:M23 family metallopeptidase, partial [Gemmatimonadota bacterium]
MNKEREKRNTSGGTPSSEGVESSPVLARTDRPRVRPTFSSFTAVFALILAVSALVLALVPGAWRVIPGVGGEFFRQPTPHEAYRIGLSQSGLAQSALGQEWIQAAEEAVARPLIMDAPYQEVGFFPAEDPSARAFRFPLRRGQRLVVRVEMDTTDPMRLFLDLFRVAPDTLRAPISVLSQEGGEEMVFEPRRTGDYLLRVQPELLRGGRFQVTIEKDPALEFPVAGRTTRSIQSFFGDERDAGRREHHGVDVFAPRGTPVLASTEALVRQVDTTPVGGRIIWLRDSKRNAS